MAGGWLRLHMSDGHTILCCARQHLNCYVYVWTACMHSDNCKKSGGPRENSVFIWRKCGIELSQLIVFVSGLFTTWVTCLRERCNNRQKSAEFIHKCVVASSKAYIWTYELRFFGFSHHGGWINYVSHQIFWNYKLFYIN